MTRVVRLVRSGNTTVFDEERSVISFREFQGFLNTLFSFPGVSFEEAENRARFLRVCYPFVLGDEHFSLECYFLQD